MGLWESKPVEQPEEQLEILRFTQQETLPESTKAYQLDDGTIFYYYRDFDYAHRPLPKRLYYKVNGMEVDVSLPDESKFVEHITMRNVPEQSLHSVAAHGNALYLNICDCRYGQPSRIDKIVFTKTKGAVVTHLRDHLKGDLKCVTANENSPFIYITQFKSKKLKTLDTRNMKFLPDLKFEGTSHIFEIVRLSKGAIKVIGADCLAIAQLPVEYFDPSTPIDCLFRDFKSEFLDKFEPLRVLGEGGFGCVFEARNRMDQWNYAVKRIPLRGSEQAVDNALKEVRTLASLKHDGIVCYNCSWIEKPPAGWQKRADATLLKKLGYDETSNYSDDCVFIYIQMELCTKSLQQWLYSTSSRDIAQAKDWFKQLVSAVHYLHLRNKIHRDLKPLNVLFDAKGRLKICDLGLIAERELRNGSEIDITRTAIGTPMYMAPEQIHGNYSSKVDIYSLGLILAELCVCMKLHQAYEAFIQYQKGRSTTILKHLPEVDKFVSWLTNVNPANRPNCDEILTRKFLA